LQEIAQVVSNYSRPLILTTEVIISCPGDTKSHNLVTHLQLLTGQSRTSISIVHSELNSNVACCANAGPLHWPHLNTFSWRSVLSQQIWLCCLDKL